MKKLSIPEGYPQLMPYLIVVDAAAFIEFTKNVFGAQERYKAMRDEKLIMHAEVTIGDSVIMLADATEQYTKQPAGLFVYVDDCDQIYAKALANGAVNKAEPADQSYGRSAGFTDAFGNTWWITSV
ncbi:VOC family protein [Mucilaginibacter sp. X4EP1]|uniref:VOC family protein n=1 Tax=Mucilaginibacter sp. X4EP1 TaxID=2723092 RepID=UPI002168207C|nr:VOC family protein [Mucilaginibacter sp. X4EP1]MCS3811759.1 PhnB protein [Mucilaginibacter sp. X4EP1]